MSHFFTTSTALAKNEIKIRLKISLKLSKTVYTFIFPATCKDVSSKVLDTLSVGFRGFSVPSSLIPNFSGAKQYSLCLSSLQRTGKENVTLETHITN
jgi:hypothetical protein